MYRLERHDTLTVIEFVVEKCSGETSMRANALLGFLNVRKIQNRNWKARIPSFVSFIKIQRKSYQRGIALLARG